MNEHDRNPEEIERDIARTRAQVGATIDEIQSRLTPGQIFDQALSYARTSLPADFGRNLADTARNNPVPIALLGIGIAWLALAGRNESAPPPRYNADDGLDGFQLTGEDGPSIGDRARMIGDRTREMRERARDSISRIGDRVGRMSERVSDMGSDARDRVSETLNDGRESMHRLSERSRRSYDHARSTVSDLIDEQPLVVGAIGLAVGAALGAALPRTEREDELMGETRDDLVDRASDSAHKVADKAVNSARAAVTGASESARHAMHAAADRVGSATEGSEQPVARSAAGDGDSRPGTDG